MKVCQGNIRAMVGLNTNGKWQIVMICEKMSDEIECECCNEVKSATVISNEKSELLSSFRKCEKALLQQFPQDGCSYHVEWKDPHWFEKTHIDYAKTTYGTIHKTSITQ